MDCSLIHPTISSSPSNRIITTENSLPPQIEVRGIDIFFAHLISSAIYNIFLLSDILLN
jgi:hypothetical protein